VDESNEVGNNQVEPEEEVSVKPEWKKDAGASSTAGQDVAESKIGSDVVLEAGSGGLTKLRPSRSIHWFRALSRLACCCCRPCFHKRRSIRACAIVSFSLALAFVAYSVWVLIDLWGAATSVSFGIAKVEASDLCDAMHIPILVHGWVSLPDAFAQSVEIGTIDVDVWTQGHEAIKSSMLVEFTDGTAYIQGGNNTFTAAISARLLDIAALGDVLSRFLNEAPLHASFEVMLSVTLRSFGIPISHTTHFTYSHACGFPLGCSAEEGTCSYACASALARLPTIDAALAQAATEDPSAEPPAEPPAEDDAQGCDLLSLRLWDGRGELGGAEAGRELMVGSAMSCRLGAGLVGASLPETFVQVFFSEEAARWRILL
ncbi:unnamed protein product, partial [Prorocentrum cordatum]